ncbi:hypothetical protein [Clostridium pasteurianum]|uniref:Uncharacterized protein n=1 Tax=Clostridium pasteurianum BC1 TaxID=86416 RepID=R4K8F0_CLOPA|nr:hypothetical protein [Clostridium pasteurianum]AGK97966.1 hypothetical protein Clopa_3151 [Clostridium pasteurianum BC1]
MKRKLLLTLVFSVLIVSFCYYTRYKNINQKQNNNQVIRPKIIHPRIDGSY